MNAYIYIITKSGRKRKFFIDHNVPKEDLNYSDEDSRPHDSDLETGVGYTIAVIFVAAENEAG